MTSLIDQLTTTPMPDFALKWRFTDPAYEVLPPNSLAQLHPLDARSAELLWNFVSAAVLPPSRINAHRRNV